MLNALCITMKVDSSTLKTGLAAAPTQEVVGFEMTGDLTSLRGFGPPPRVTLGCHRSHCAAVLGN